MSANCDIIDIFPKYGQFGAIQKPDAGCIEQFRIPDAYPTFKSLAKF